MKIDIPETHVGVSSNVQDYAKNARKFLIDNVNRITFSHDDEQKILGTQDSMTHTIMSELYQQAFSGGKLDMFRLLIFDKIDKVPSWFLISWLDIDILELRDTDKSSADVLNSISAYRDKILVDITPYYNISRKRISDTSSFYNRLVRAMLCRSYHQSKSMWLTPSLIYQLTKFYAMIISSKIGRTYNLELPDQYVAATALSIFFVNRCSTSTSVINPMMGRMDFLRKIVDTKMIYEYIEENYSVTDYNLNSVVDVITKFCPARIGQFTLSTLYDMCKSLTSNQLISLIALEYPPYWCHLIISAMSGDKSSMFHSIKTLNMKRDAVLFEDDILKTNSFIRSL